MSRICVVSEEYPPDTAFGGIAFYYESLARELSERGHKVFVISRGIGDANFKLENENITIIRIKPKFFKRGILEKFIGYRLAVMIELIMLCKNEKIDIIETPEWKAELFLAFLLRLHKKLPPIIIRLHGCRKIIRKYDGGYISLGDRIVCFMERYSLKNCSQITAISESVLEETEKLLKISLANKTKVIYNFVKCKSVEKKSFSRSKVILFAGRLDSLKGAFIVAPVINKILGEYDEVEWHLAGRDIWIEAEKKFGSEIILSQISEENRKRVKFLGQLERDVINEEYRKAFLTILPSNYESFGLCCAESMANKTPVIGSRNGGMAEIILCEKNGFLVLPNDIDDVEAKIKYLLNNPDFAIEMGERAYERIVDFFADNIIIPQIIAYYKEIISRKRNR